MNVGVPTSQSKPSRSRRAQAADIQVSIDKGPLTISGERKPHHVAADNDPRDDIRKYAQERFVWRFARVIERPQHADPDRLQARYTNGCLSITVGKREASSPRAITVK